jgi:membrane AbrB-like protein
VSRTPPQLGRWALLAVAAGACALLLRAMQIPGAVLLGPMFVAIGFALAGAKLKLTPAVLIVVQAVLGCMVASAISAPLLRLVADHWFAVLAANLLSVAVACLVAVALTRAGWLPGQCAIWGLSPGAASTMMMLGEARGEDPRVIALMQNLRIVIVTLTATAVAAFAGYSKGASSQPAFFNAGYSVQGLLVLAALVAAGIAAAMMTGRAQAAFWLPALGGGALNAAGLATVDIPAAVAAIAFGIGGCYAGLRFDRRALTLCFKLLPAMLLGIALLIVACLGLMWPIRRSFPDIDALTAFLAIMPGGIDAAVAIAQGMETAVPVIVAVQLMRLLVVSLVAPSMARLVAGLSAARQEPS